MSTKYNEFEELYEVGKTNQLIWEKGKKLLADEATPSMLQRTLKISKGLSQKMSHRWRNGDYGPRKQGIKKFSNQKTRLN